MSPWFHSCVIKFVQVLQTEWGVHFNWKWFPKFIAYEKRLNLLKGIVVGPCTGYQIHYISKVTRLVTWIILGFPNQIMEIVLLGQLGFLVAFWRGVFLDYFDGDGGKLALFQLYECRTKVTLCNILLCQLLQRSLFRILYYHYKKACPLQPAIATWPLRLMLGKYMKKSLWLSTGRFWIMTN